MLFVVVVFFIYFSQSIRRNPLEIYPWMPPRMDSKGTVLTCYVCGLASRSHYVVVVVFFLDINKCHPVSELLFERASRLE